LVVVVFAFSKTVNDVAQQQTRLRDFDLVRLFEVTNHLVSDLILGLRPPCASTVSRRMEHNLSVLCDVLDWNRPATENLDQCQLRLRAGAPREGKRHRLKPMLSFELIEGSVSLLVGGMLDSEDRRIFGRFGLGKNRLVQGPGWVGW